MARAPYTKIVTQHVISIRINGQTIGYIQTFVPSQTRTLTPVYEINSSTSGRRIEIAPGNVDADTLGVSRYDIYRKLMWQAFGFSATIVHLSDHLRPFDVKEIWKTPEGETYGTLYTGCWFSDTGRSFGATGDRLVLVSATLQVTDRLPLR